MHGVILNDILEKIFFPCNKILEQFLKYEKGLVSMIISGYWQLYCGYMWENVLVLRKYIFMYLGAYRAYVSKWLIWFKITFVYVCIYTYTYAYTYWGNWDFSILVLQFSKSQQLSQNRKTE